MPGSHQFVRPIGIWARLARLAHRGGRLGRGRLLGLLIRRRLLRLLRWRVWFQEKLQPTEWQLMLLWAAGAGFLGALASVVFSALTENIYSWFGQSSVGIVDSMSRLPWWGCLLVPTLFHGTYDFALMHGLDWKAWSAVTGISIGLWAFVLHRVHRAQRASPFRPKTMPPRRHR